MTMISFVVIGKDEGWRLKKCFTAIRQFVRNENINSFEIIYVDSKSEDESIEIAKEFKIDKIFLIEGTCNAAIGRNIGAMESTGDILFFLDGDMELLSGFYRHIINEQGHLIYPFISGIERDILHDNNWNFIEARIRRKYTEGIDQYSMTTGGLFVIDKNLWLKIGGMDNNQTKSQDLDLGIRLDSIGFPLLRKGELWVNHYTQYYAIRSVSLKGVKYSARLTRKHILNYKAQKHLLISNYSYWTLLLTIAIMVCSASWLPIACYLLFPMYRSIRTICRTTIKMNIFVVFVRRIQKDILFLFYLFFYWPKLPVLKYKECD